MKLRVKFAKTGPMRFIGHLDFLRTFQKIFRKAGIPIAFTEGFSPHPIFSIAAPLAVGVTSEGEYLDLELYEPMDENTLVESLNRCCPDGLTIIEAVPIEDKEPSAMGIVTASKYRIEQVVPTITEEMLNAFMIQEQIIVQKTTKSGNIKDMDLKSSIFHISLMDHKLVMTLATGSTVNVKPEMVLEALCAFAKVAYAPFNYKIHRVDLYHGEVPFKSLMEPVLSVDSN